MDKIIRNLSGPIIRRLRVSRGWSQSDLAAKCQAKGWDISRDIIAAIEGQIREVNESEVVLLSAVFEVEAATLLPAKNLVLGVAAIASENTTKKKKRLWGLFSTR